MLKRVYIDNYKSLVNVDIPLKEINLFLGENGSGKSTVFYALKSIRDFVCNGLAITQTFPPETRTRWQSSPFQTFELEVEGNDGIYRYELAVEHNVEREKARVSHERLFFDDKPLLRLETGEVHLYRDDFSAGPSYFVDWTLSVAGAIPPRYDNTKLTWFKDYISHFIIVQIIPVMMHEESPQEENLPSLYMENYTSWYRYISQDQGIAFQLMQELKQVLDGFNYFRFEPFGERHRLLKIYFQGDDTSPSIGYTFNELSDGQKMLITLYSLLYATRIEPISKYTLFIDEPENFLALPEIQPWLTELYDSCMDRQVQAILISHHPEFINYLLASPVGYWFERQSNRPTRVKPVTVQEQDGVPISEIIARGWLNV
ncbi:MAG: AAA family ATPase [Anaerolineae bacterium]|nr:AAA family ATPase [Anaerolineae bacterium]